MNDINPKFVVGALCALGILGVLIQLPVPSIVGPVFHERTRVESIEPSMKPVGDEVSPLPHRSRPAPPAVTRTEVVRVIERPVVPQKSEAELAEERAAQAARERMEFLERYVNASFVRPTGKKLVAILTASRDGKPSGAVNAALSKKLRKDGIEVTGSLLKGEFVADGLFNQVFDGSTALLERLELGGKADTIFLARQSIDYVKNPDLENVITASMQVETQVIHLPANVVAGGWTFQAKGAGFSEADARLQAEERLVKQIEKDGSVLAFPE